MKLLIIHHAHYDKIRYHESIDHSVNDMVYVGRPGPMSNIPADLRCGRITISQDAPMAEAIIAETSPEDKFDAVLALSEQGMLEAHSIRRHLGLPDVDSLEMLEAVRDKVNMKAALAGSGIEFPRYVASLEPGQALPWHGATVVKPRRGATSVGVEMFADTQSALRYYWQHPHRESLEVEQFIDAPVHHVDGLVADGRPEEMVVSRYIGTNPGYGSGKEPLGSVQQPFRPEWDEFTRTVVSSLKVMNGSIHLEFFQMPDGRQVFLEIANRMGGGGIGLAHLRRTGFDIPKNDIALRLGWKRPDPGPRSGRYHGWLQFPGHWVVDHGSGEVEVPEHIRQSPCLDDLSVVPDRSSWPRHLTTNESACPVSLAASHPDHRVVEDFIRTCIADIRWGM